MPFVSENRLEEALVRAVESPATAPDFYRLLLERLPQTAIVSIGHRSSLVAFHKRFLEMTPERDGLTHLLPASPVGSGGTDKSLDATFA